VQSPTPDVMSVAHGSDTDKAVRGAGEGIFEGLDPFTFDLEEGAAYDADYPDVLSAAGGGAVDLAYEGGGGASVERELGERRVVAWGFPFEAVADADARALLMERILLFLVPEVPAAPEPAEEEEPDASTDPPGEECHFRTECGCSIVW
jgi:hypothetical protein